MWNHTLLCKYRSLHGTLAPSVGAEVTYATPRAADSRCGPPGQMAFLGPFCGMTLSFPLGQRCALFRNFFIFLYGNVAFQYIW